jgi:hypothetical protein
LGSTHHGHFDLRIGIGRPGHSGGRVSRHISPVIAGGLEKSLSLRGEAQKLGRRVRVPETRPGTADLLGQIIIGHPG